VADVRQTALRGLNQVRGGECVAHGAGRIERSFYWGPTGSVITQLWGVGTTPSYGFVMSMIILKLIGVSIGLRVTLEEEREGLDISLNGESVG
jgi:ammonia channel protein AmtB